MMTKPDVYIYVSTLYSLCKFCQFSSWFPYIPMNPQGFKLRLFPKFPQLNFQGNVFRKVYGNLPAIFWTDHEQANAFSPLSLSVVACITLKALCCWCTALPKEPPQGIDRSHGFGLDCCLPPGCQLRKWPSHLGRTSLPVPSVRGQVKLLQSPKYRQLIKTIVYVRIN